MDLTTKEHAARQELPMPGHPAGRFGRLPSAPGVGPELRCACDRCGAHLMAHRAGRKQRPDGVCPVCGGEAVSPV